MGGGFAFLLRGQTLCLRVFWTACDAKTSHARIYHAQRTNTQTHTRAKSVSEFFLGNRGLSFLPGRGLLLRRGGEGSSKPQ